MAIEPEKIKAIFLAAVEKATPAERAVFLDAACAGDPAGRRRLDALLRAHDEPGNLLDGLAPSPGGSGDALPGDPVTPADQADPLPETGDVPAPPSGPDPLGGLSRALQALRWLWRDSGPLQAAAVPPRPPASDADSGDGRRGGDTVVAPPEGATWRDQYELLDRIGRGAMGVVYKARQLGLNRLVAVKTILSGPDATLAERARFSREAESMARLRHAHIVQVYAVGECDGCPFFSMELLEGGSLARQIAGRPQPARQAAEYLEALARAMHYAHQQGIIHRDLKPGNVILTADGVPKITDFGLARQLHAEPGAPTPEGQTASGVVMGTAAYMPPEQAAGRAKEVGPLSDVYALGAILFELLTGRAPFRGADYLETLRAVQESDPPRPRTLNPQADAELEAVCLKCLEKKPTDRYPSAEALADDLARWLRGEATLARPRRWPARLARALRRHPLRNTAIALAGLAAVLTAVLVPVVAYLRDPARQVEYAQRELRRGHAVTLLGETGRPSWFRPSTDPTTMLTSVAEDGAFSFGDNHESLLELLPDPQIDSYRFSAEVRFDSSDPENDSANVGVYFAHSQGATPQGAALHYFCHVVFVGSAEYPEDTPN